MRYLALDGLRGVMTICVFIAHVDYYYYPGAIIYMDTFFIMSSFFITRILLNDISEKGIINFKDFYSRRIKRLFPALFLMLITFTILDSFSSSTHWKNYTHLYGAFFYYSNWLRAFAIPHEYIFGHTWSLSIEEQFYIVWPLILTLLYKNNQDRNKGIKFLTAITLLCLFWRILLVFGDASADRLYNGTDVRLDSLSIGALLAFSSKTYIVRKLGILFSHPISICMLIVLMLFGGLNVDYQQDKWYLWQQPLFEIISTALLLGIIFSKKNRLITLLFENQVSVYLGKICYGIYLWHYPILVVASTTFNLNILQQFVICGPLTISIAALSYEILEKPILSRKKDQLN